MLYSRPLFSTKSIWMTRFFWIPMWKGPFFWHPCICTYFRSECFRGCLFFGVQWIDCDICLTISNKWVQKIKGQYMNRSLFQMIKYMNGSVFSKGQVYEWGRFWNTGSHTRTTITPKLPPPWYYIRLGKKFIDIIELGYYFLTESKLYRKEVNFSMT